ncbi:DNA fragmentation factor subunit alpha isoform X1 [Electrophorus electricus]|uniref:CIDE-N domain-containing protein n=1 Tax=Electrophorus electricus TaxID=8005 RepID=A0A4W4H976_ELEEL|nr:DNA fragmentation factor subunit alpha isoform X1 [Electrophorus electricus]
MADLKPCKVCNATRQRHFGLVVCSLDQLRVKGSGKLGFDHGTPVLVTLEDDGTIVEDEDYFLCLPSNTKFMLLSEKEIWTPASRCDGHRARLSQDSFEVEADVVDSLPSGAEGWHGLARQLRQDLASIILMSEADLQSLVDVPCADLASVLGFPEQKAKDLQDTLQRFLDRREEERQSRELLQLFLKALEKEDGQAALQEGGTVEDETDGLEMNSVAGISSRTLQVLKTKMSPATRLSNTELQQVLNAGSEAMAEALGWDGKKTADLTQACEAELVMRVQQLQALQALSTHSERNEATPTTPLHKRAKRS